jgi:5-formyltetrahydrofolate cyclo-ligase
VAEPHRPRDSAAGPDPAKLALRDQILTARNRLAVAELGAAGTAITGHLFAEPEVRRAATVAAYVSTASEPGTGVLLDALVDAGKRVILPVLLPDDDLDWAVYQGESALLPARRGILEPAGPRLGVEAVATADVVLVPGLAVSGEGVRLGRGGGSYDRALARVPAGTFTCVLLHDGEVGRDVPVAPHDRAVVAAATPAGITRFRRGPG